MTHARAHGKHQTNGAAPAAASKGGRKQAPAAQTVTGGSGLHSTAGPALRLGPSSIQTKLAVGPVDDPFEREANSVAESVAAGRATPPISRLGSPAAQRQAVEDEPVQRQPDASRQPDEEQLQRQAEEEEPLQRAIEKEEPVQRQADQEEPLQRAIEEEEPVQRRADAARQPDEEQLQRQADEEKEPVQRSNGSPSHQAANGSSGISPATAATIRNPGPGRPLSPGVRRRIEPRLGADLGGVRVHAGASAARAASSIKARAFTHRQHIFLGPSESPGDLHLMAHEATHVVQQGAATAGPLPGPSPAGDNIQRLPAFIMEGLNEYARYIPGYTLFTVIIGFNPLLGEPVERNAINLLQGLMGLVPLGTIIFDKLQEYGVIQDAFVWVEGELGRLNLSLGRIESTFEAAWADVRFLEGFDYNLNVLQSHFGGLLNDVVSFAQSLVSHIMELIKEAAIGVAEGLLAENRAWALIKKVLHYDPLRDQPVEATTVEILEDFLLLIGKDQELEQMRERGTLQETADWLDTQLAIFLGLLAQLRLLITAAWDAIQPENLVNLGANLQTLATQAFSFLQQVWDFASTVALMVLELIKKALLSWLSSFVNEVPGFHLITVILGRDPFTQQPVPRTAENIIRGFITLLPGGNATYDQLQETGVIGAAAARIEGAMSELGISWEFIVGLFTGIWNSLTITDLIDPIGAFLRIRDQFGEPIARLFAFVRVVVEEIFKLLLELMHFPTDLIASIITNALLAFEAIKNDPVGFLMNMLAAVKLGFTNFFNNILSHLVGGLVDWLFRGLRDAGIEPPRDLSLGSILDFVLDVLGISMERIWQKLAERFGQETVDRIRGAIDRLMGIWAFVRDVQERGVVAIWEYIESQISGLWSMVLEMATQWIMERIIVRATTWLLSLLDPTGIMPVINSFIAFFNAVQSAIEYLRDMLEIVNQYVATIASVARGALDVGAQRLEQALADAIPIALGFLANQFGLGRIGEKIAEIVGGIRSLIDRALDWLLDQAERAIQGLMGMLGFGVGEGEEQPVAEEDAEFIYEKSEGAHTIKIRRDLKVFRFSDPMQLSGQESQEELQEVLEALVPVARPSYSTDSLGRAAGPSGYVEGVKDKEGRESLPAVARLPGGLAAYQPGDERGHLIGDRFYGPAAAGNLVPMHTALNNSTFKTYENTVASSYKQEVDAGHAVLLHMSVRPNYPNDDGTIPASFRPETVDATSKVITLKAGSTTLETEETAVPGGTGLVNPSAGVTSFAINVADETTMKAVLSPLNPDKRLVIETILENRPFDNPEDFIEVVLLRIERSTTVNDERRARIFDALAAIQDAFLPQV